MTNVLVPPATLASQHYCEPGSEGHLVNVTMDFSVQEKPSGGRGSKAVVKKDKSTKMEYIPMCSISHVDFIKAFLSVHSLSEQFSPGIHSGPSFKLLK
ncbi:hypothetical protein BDN71DRAFT_1508606 [Pleurotus eryngii]|uniref:Uncharacterized protein n=1 Tax=Pleurotus eryngii TaxID=5323 RepID=A0A9P6DF87_PLEER|nr:hypothetical protein BDN71DRAFT_1508606 [Pleurotus eryngii]